jgi:hypothetical protein
MAGRQLQRLLRDQLPPADNDQHGDEATTISDEEEDDAPSKAFNPFDLLTDEDGATPSDASEEEEEEEEEEPEEAPRPTPPSKKTKAKKKAPAAAVAEEKEEDIDAILQELDITPSSSIAQADPSSSQIDAAFRSLFAVTPANLRAEEELKRMFGSMGMRGGTREAEDPAAAFAGASRRVRRLAARGLLTRIQQRGGSTGGGSLRPGVLITPRDTWPRPDGSVSMQAGVPDSQGHPTFTLVFNDTYRAQQSLYEEVQATHDPNAVAAMLRSHPFHLDALLTMADVYRSMAEHTYADEMIERCVYVLEMAWPPGFFSAAGHGTARVAYNEANEPLFIALFRYIQTMGRRGLHRTALEVCKLVLQLDESDPMGVLQTIDYFAVRSGQYEYLQQLLEGQGTDGDSGSVALFPNMVFSLALSKWYQENKQSDKSASENLLVKAILLHPLVVVRLQAKLAEQGVGKDSKWADALNHPLYKHSSDGRNAGLSHLINIFVERQAALWKAGPVQDWLFGAVRKACASNTDDLPNGVFAATWEAIRQQAFPPSEDNTYSHLRLFEYSDSAPRLPPEEIHGLGLGLGQGGGQQQGRGEIEEAELMAQLQAMAENAGLALPGEGGGAAALHDVNPMIALLRSLMPWAADGQQPDYTADDNDEHQQRREDNNEQHE